MGRGATKQRRLAALAVAAALAAAGACAPGTPALIPTASFSTSVDGAGYSATAPLWAAEVHSDVRPDQGIVSHTLTITDPLAATLLPNTALWPASGMYQASVGFFTDGSAPRVGTFPVGTGHDEVGLVLRVMTWEDRRQPIDDQSFERRWACRTNSAGDIRAATGTVRVTQVTTYGSELRSIGLAWDLQCPRWIETDAGQSSGTPERHWVGSATYNS